MWKKPNKFSNVKAVDPSSGIRFDSKAELARYLDLRLLERCGELTELELQPKFPIEVNGVRVCHYIADFRYKDSKGQTVVEDVKGFLDKVYRLKKKLFEAQYAPLKITEIKNVRTKRKR